MIIVLEHFFLNHLPIFPTLLEFLSVTLDDQYFQVFANMFI
jgi:hypothetical protein